MRLAKGVMGRPEKMRRVHPRWLWVAGVLVTLFALIVASSFLVDEPLRRYVEGEMNGRMAGYTITIHRLSFHPVGFSLTLYDLTFVQKEHPDPPVLRVPQLDARVQWRALLQRRLVANFRLDEPKLYANLTQLRTEAKDPRPVTHRGWQDAFQAIYPLKINELRIVDGEVTYVDQGPFKPLHLSRVNIVADNIRNIWSPERTYPSELHADAVVFKSGRLSLRGKADFLAKPHPGVLADITLEAIELDYFKPIVRHYAVDVRGGSLSANGEVEYAPTIKTVDLKHATIRGVRLDYIHRTPERDVAAKAATTVQSTKKVANRPDIVLRARQVRIAHSDLGVVNKVTSPEYRAFLSNADVRVTNLSNQRAEGTSVAEIRGKFMGSGDTAVTATFRPSTRGPDVNVDLRIENTDLTAMNDLLRAYGRFDVVRGSFSFYSELNVKDGRVEGYLKPLFKRVKAFGPEQDREKSVMQKLKERLIGAAASVLRNVPRREVATRVDISGPVEHPNYSAVQVLGRLIQNAFFKAILPGFDRISNGTGPGTGRAEPSDARKKPGSRERGPGGEGVIHRLSGDSPLAPAPTNAFDEPRASCPPVDRARCYAWTSFSASPTICVQFAQQNTFPVASTPCPITRRPGQRGRQRSTPHSIGNQGLQAALEAWESTGEPWLSARVTG